MSGLSETSRSDNPNAPQIAAWVYVVEREVLAGSFVGAIFYGIVVALFFQCMGALLNPVNRIRGSTKWGLVAHTVAMFLFLTFAIADDLNDRSNSYIDERNFPGDDELPPGPFGSMSLISIKGINLAYAAVFPLNQWLADGLLLHRCSLVYFMNYWVMVFPCIIYLASVATGIAYIYEQSTDGVYLESIGISFLSMALSLTILLTLMIIVRLMLYSRNMRKAMGPSYGTSRLYRDIVTMLIESYALYALTFLTYAIPWAIDSYVASTVSKLLGSAQVIAPYLIVLRVANRRALTNDVISGTGSVGSLNFDFKGQGTTTDASEGTFPDGAPVSLVGVNSEAACGRGAGPDDAIGEVPL